MAIPAKTQTEATFSWDTQNSSLGTHALKAEVDPVTGESNTANNSATLEVSLYEPRHDVAVIALDAPASATAGNPIPVKVTVENQGTTPENTSVLLRDATESRDLGTQAVTLSAGEQKLVGFNWDTAGASLGTHTLETSVATVPGETDTADNTMTNTSELLQPSLHVADITMSLAKKVSNYQATAKVKITDGANQIVPSATVTGDFYYNGALLNTASGQTLADGTVSLSSNWIRATKGSSFSVTVRNVSKSGYTYDSFANVKTSASVRV